MNTEFENMIDSQKRVAIATDVIQQLNAGEIVPVIGFYYKENSHGYPCEVCALGALFRSKLKLNYPKEVKLPSTFKDQHSGYIFKILSEYFPFKMLNEIEEAFENSEEYFSSSARLNRFVILEEIMKNIIKNNGEFIPLHLAEV